MLPSTTHNSIIHSITFNIHNIKEKHYIDYNIEHYINWAKLHCMPMVNPYSGQVVTHE